jgi:hypothetical protein
MKLDHAAIGNGRVLALVAPDSSIDWLCLPRFDSPSVFARLLDLERGGNWAILPAEGEVRGNLRYIPNTNVVSTHFEAAGAAWEVIDFAPRIPDGLTMRVRWRSSASCGRSRANPCSGWCSTRGRITPAGHRSCGRTAAGWKSAASPASSW